jgi:hypothetical protein
VFLLGYHEDKNEQKFYEHVVELDLSVDTYIVVKYSKTYGMPIEKDEKGNFNEIISNGMILFIKDGINKIYLLNSF